MILSFAVYQGIFNQVFEYARIEAGELVLNMEKVNAGNLFTEIISMFYEDFLKKGCEPEIEIVPKALFIQADRHAFSRILENLIKNALVHGKVHIQKAGLTYYSIPPACAPQF